MGDDSNSTQIILSYSNDITLSVICQADCFVWGHNILLDDLDKELERRGHRFVRYADDFIILVKSQRAGERVMASVQCFFERKLNVKVNQDKSQAASTNQTNFLGFTFRGTRIRWSDI